VLNQFLVEHPGNAEAYAFLSWRYHYLKRPEESASCALRAYGLSPENWHVCWTVLNAARYWPETVCESDAMRVAAEIEARFPCDAFLQVHVCHLYATYGRKERALGRLRHLEALPHDEHGPDRRLADLFTRLNRWPEAVEAYCRLLALPGRKTPDLLASLGEALRGLRDPMADTAFAEAQRLAKTWNDFLFLAEAYERCGLCAEAAAAARHVLAFPALPARPRRDAETLLRRLGA
jgi:tetratricopeptide (TPR) repeat protein